MRTLYVIIILLVYTSGLSAQVKSTPVEKAGPSDYSWLEDRHGAEAINWTESQNQRTLEYFGQIEILPIIEKWNVEFKSKKERINRDSIRLKLAPVGQQGPFAQIATDQIWARMPFDDYLNRTAPPNILHVDSLFPDEKEELEYDEVICRGPDYNDCLVYLKKKDGRRLKSIIEVDREKGEVIAGGFKHTAANTQVFWRDDHSVYITTNLAHPRAFGHKLRVWERGQDLEKARVMYETDEYDVRLRLFMRGKELFMEKEYRSFDSEYFLIRNDELIRLNLARDINDIKLVSGQLVVRLRSSWQPDEIAFPSGSLIAIDFEAFVQGSKEFQLVMGSSHSLVVDKIWNTNDVLIVRTLEDVRSGLWEWTFSDGDWSSRVIGISGGEIDVFRTQDEANRYFIDQTHFLYKSSYMREPDGQIVYAGTAAEPVDTSAFQVDQWFATSKDGTRVPYFVIRKKDMPFDGNNPVIMTGYGGWGYAELPFSLNTYCRWLEDGGVFVSTNIRGGGEYGHEWHFAAVREKRQNAFDDFHAIADDLIERKVTHAGRIGTFGGSNGGLLVTISFIQRPELYGAVISRMGSLELKGCSGVPGVKPTGERGDAAIPEDWAYMQHYSPFHNLEAGKDYPPILLYASRGDDISHPCHSRKFAKKMMDLGYEDVYYMETEKGGHGRLDIPNRMEIDLSFFYKHIHPDYDKIVDHE